MVFLLFKLLMFSKKNDSCLYIINTPDFQVRDTLIEKNKKRLRALPARRRL